MRILIATPMFPPESGDPAPYVQGLAERLSEAHTVTVVAYASTSIPLSRARLITVDKARSLPSRMLRFFLKVFIRSMSADVVVCHGALASGVPAALACMLTRKPLIVRFINDESWHGYYEPGSLPSRPASAQLRAFLQKIVLRSARTVLVSSAAMANHVKGAYGVAAAVVPDPLEPDERIPFTPSLVLRSILMSGKLDVHSGAEEAVAGFKDVTNRFPDATLMVMAEGPLEGKLREARAANITFPGVLPRAEAAFERRSAELEIILNGPESGREAAHARRTGKPVIMIDGPWIEKNESDDGPLIVDKESGAISTAISELFQNGGQRAQMVKVGKEEANRNTWESHLANLSSVLESL
jgi:glycosyltransferase involved in cell wall biosynthesis